MQQPGGPALLSLVLEKLVTRSPIPWWWIPATEHPGETEEKKSWLREHGSKDKFYDIDFWLTEKDGQLEVTEARIHKEPKNEDGVWAQMPRYNFEKEKVKDLH